MRRLLAAGLLLLILALGGLACHKTGPKPESHSSRGRVVAFKENGKVIVINHEAFPGFMDAMTMPFEIEKPELAANLKVGDTVSFTIEARENGWPITAIQKTEAPSKK